MNPTKNKVAKVNGRQVEELNSWQRINGHKVIPKNAEEKVQSMPQVFGKPGPARRRHPLAPA